jgi:hypothetical protein
MFNTEISRRIKAELALARAMGTQYRLRTLTRIDVEPIHSILQHWVVSWFEANTWDDDDSYVGSSGMVWASLNWDLDTEVQFILRAGAPSLNEIRWLINALSPGDIAAQTLELTRNYTGKPRNDLLGENLVRPSNEVIKLAIDGILWTTKCRGNEAERSGEVVQRLQDHIDDAAPASPAYPSWFAKFIASLGNKITF